MNTIASGFASVLVLFGILCPGPASAELSVTVTISGSIEEMLPIIQHLKDMGFGIGPAAEAGETIKLEMHSVAPVGAEEALAPAEPAEAAPALEETVTPEPEPEPVLALLDASVEPAASKAGGAIFVTVTVSDPDHVVDTVAMVLGDQTFDLYDNGTHHDAEPGDGVWSCAATIPTYAALGDREILIVAYGVGGEPVMTEGEGGRKVPLTTAVKVAVK